MSSEKFKKSYFCAVEGCGAGSIKKMSNHLISKHKILDPEKIFGSFERERATKAKG
jgi:hypothetical protein